MINKIQIHTYLRIYWLQRSKRDKQNVNWYLPDDRYIELKHIKEINKI
jgi:hypothetical protein